MLNACVEDARTSSSSGSNNGFKLVVDVLNGVRVRVDTALGRLRLGDERTAEAERQRLREATHSRRRFTIAAAKAWRVKSGRLWGLARH